MTSQSQGSQLDTLIQSFLETKQSQETARAYKREIRGLFDHMEQEITTLDSFLAVPYSIMCDEVSSYITAHKKTNPHTGRTTNPRSINRKLYALSAFFKYLQKKHGYPDNPARILEPVAVPRRSSTPSPTEHEVHQLLIHLQTYRMKGVIELRNTILLLLMFLLALRRSEAANLKWSDIDFKAKTLILIQKGGTEKRLPVPGLLINLLLDFQEVIKSPASTTEPKPEHVFRDLRNSKDRPISGATVYNIVKSIIDNLLPGSRLTPHSFRKAFIEQALDRKNDLVSIANATGHASIEMIKYYDTRDTIKNNAIHDVSEMMDW